MRVVAPGKLLLAGAYAVLEGAPALVVAIDRYAVADSAVRGAAPTPEMLAAMTAEEAPAVDATALRDGPHKLGLGSSAAILVAALGALAARAGKDLAEPSVRHALLGDARRAHAAVQSGGSGVDVAASVYGGALEYAMGSAASGASVRPLDLPNGVVLDVFWSGTPATTSDMRARIDAFQAKDAKAHRRRIDAVAAASWDAIAAARAGDASRFIEAVREGGRSLVALGSAADAPIVPHTALPLAPLAEADGGAFVPSGAGGGDVFVHVGPRMASPSFVASAALAGMRRISMNKDPLGVRVA